MTESKGREITGDYIPDSLEIHIEIIVNQHVPHPGNRFPVDFGVDFFVNRIDSAHGFPENLNIANDGVPQSVRGKHGITARGRICAHSADTPRRVRHISALRFQSGTASLRTASRIRGLKDL